MWKRFLPLQKRCNEFATAAKIIRSALGRQIVFLGQKLDSTSPIE
jgi:hypothetical protein